MTIQSSKIQELNALISSSSFSASTDFSWKNIFSKKALLAAILGSIPVFLVGGISYGLVETSLPEAIIEQLPTKPVKEKLIAVAAGGTILTALISAIISSLTIRRSIIKIEQAKEALIQLAQGKFNINLPVVTKDELGNLHFQINQTAQELQNLIQNQSANFEQLIFQNHVLLEMSRHESLSRGDAVLAAESFSVSTAQALNVNRVNIWRYDPFLDELVCLDGYEANHQIHNREINRSLKDCPEFFRHIRQNRQIVILDAANHSVTLELLDKYLIPANIRSALYVPICIANKLLGVICCEQTDDLREWQLQEQSFISSVGNLMAVVLENQNLQSEIAKLLEIVSAIERGDFKKQIPVNDRLTGLIADKFNGLIGQFSQVLTEVSNTAQFVSESADTLTSCNQIVAKNLWQQSQATETAIKLGYQVETFAQDWSKQIDFTNQSLEELNSVIFQGKNSLEEFKNGMEVLNQGNNRMVQEIKTLGEFIGLSEQFVQQQNQIASMTQVLALNATLVAARASEQKDARQFAVVANEFEAIATQISNLAGQTDRSLESLEQKTAQINQVVTIIARDVDNNSQLIDSFSHNIQESERLFDLVSDVAQKVLQAGESAKESNQQIVNFSQKTSCKMNNIAKFAQDTTESIAETQKKSEELKDLSNNLLGILSNFSGKSSG